MVRKTEKADLIDKHIGHIIRHKRELLKMTQGDLARITGVTYQQIHKYEKGVNRISAGRLSLIAEGLAMPVAEFFTEPEKQGVTHAHPTHEAADKAIDYEFSRYFRQVPDPRQREAIYLLVKAIAEKSS